MRDALDVPYLTSIPRTSVAIVFTSTGAPAPRQSMARMASAPGDAQK